MDKVEVDVDYKTEVGNQTPIANDEKSQGVARIEAISSSYTKVSLGLVLIGIFLFNAAFGLDSLTRTIFQTYATNSYSNHSLISTINVVHSIASAAIQPPISIAANIFGRFELFSFSIALYIIGTILEACSKNIETFAGAQVIYTIGWRSFILIFVILIADISSTRNRILFHSLTSISYLIITWFSGNITSSIMANSTWEWGIAMWAIIIPVSAIPIFISLFMASRNAKKQGKLDNIQPTFTGKNLWENLVILFWRLDIIGIFIIAAILCLLLIPLTIAGGIATRWAHADIIVMLVLGILCIPAFIFWEIKFAKYPCVPFHLLNNRGVLSCFVISFLLNGCWYLQGDYLFTVLRVSFDLSDEPATRIYSLYPLVAVIASIIAGLVIRYVRRAKWVAVIGAIIYILALGLMIKYRSSSENGIVGVTVAQVGLGLGGGLVYSIVQAIIQFETKHEHVAIITSLYLTVYTVGAAVGNSVAGAIWTNTLPGKLEENFMGFNNATALHSDAYGSPLTFIEKYPMGTPERSAMTGAYDYTQRILTITGCAMAVPLLIATLTLHDRLLGDTQSLPNAEENENKK
ncbi:MFS general substrate transporter [Cunninghamella echinulata]|nr:MFS general substrate transporter [Cunninghamella echinulata]